MSTALDFIYQNSINKIHYIFNNCNKKKYYFLNNINMTNMNRESKQSHYKPKPKHLIPCIKNETEKILAKQYYVNYHVACKSFDY